jgi:hypothetical protein
MKTISVSVCLSVCLVILQLFFCSDQTKIGFVAMSPTLPSKLTAALFFVSEINNPEDRQ